MPHTLLDRMACEAGRAAARAFQETTQTHVPIYGLMELTRVCGDAIANMDTRRAQIGSPMTLLQEIDYDEPGDSYAKLDLKCQRRQGVINDLERRLNEIFEVAVCKFDTDGGGNCGRPMCPLCRGLH